MTPFPPGGLTEATEIGTGEFLPSEDLKWRGRATKGLNDMHRISQLMTNPNPGLPILSPEQLCSAICRTKCSKHLLNDSVYKKSKIIPDVLGSPEKMVLSGEY